MDKKPEVVVITGAHGRFDRLAHNFSLQLWLDQPRGWVAAGRLLGLLGGLLMTGRGISRITERKHESAIDSRKGRRKDVRAGLCGRR